ncbi:hypothetical protein HY991_04305, partial [Candidatus Micrarchaeota archaeon]|nr:hypothetical protein [Candidatus Micrarchaeota archaeon]
MSQGTENLAVVIMLFLFLAAVLIWVFKPAEVTGWLPAVNVTTVNITMTATVVNQTPQVTVCNAEAAVAPCAMGASCASGDKQQVWINATVVDENGYSDIDLVNATVYLTSAGASETSTDANNSKRYFVGRASSPQSICIETLINATAAWYNCSFNISWFAQKGGWTASVTANDTAQLRSTKTCTFTMDPCLGIASDPVNGGTIAFGNVNPGYTSNQTFNVTNRCNDQLDLKLQGQQFCTGGCVARILLGTGTTVVNVTFAYGLTAVPSSLGGNGLNTTGYYNTSDNLAAQVTQA